MTNNTIGTFTVVPAASYPDLPGGMATSMANGRVFWQLSLGNHRNGQNAGALAIAGDGLATKTDGTLDWSSFYTPKALYINSDSASEVSTYMSTGLLRQVFANEVAIDILWTTGATSYKLLCYQPAQVQGTSGLRTFTGLPFATYTVQQDTTPTKIKITKETRTITGLADTSTTAPIVRTEWTTLEAQGTAYPALTWILTDWTLAGTTNPLQKETRIWATDGNGGYNETITVAGPDNAVVAQNTRVNTRYAWGNTPTSTTQGTTNAVTTNVVYNIDSTNAASYGFVQSQTVTGGAWIAYDYFPTTDTLKLGTISHAYAPYLNAPAAVSTSATAGAVTSYTYAADPFGMLTRLTQAQTSINNVPTANTNIAYTTSTVNGLHLVTATRTDQTISTGPSLSTVTEYYQEDVYDDFFRGQTHSTKSPTGVKQAYVRQLGSLSGTTFTPSATGRASRIGVIKGTAAASTGATLLTAYAGYTVSPVYLIPNKSTLDMTVRDVYARVARTESYVWSGAAWQLVSYVNFSYNSYNKLLSRVVSNGDDTEAQYIGELKTWEQDGTGITMSYDYDTADRVLRATKAGYSAASLVTTYTYNAADQVTSQSTAAGGNESLTSSRSYDLAGRVFSETAPGVGATTYAYDPVGRTSTVTHSDTSTRIQTFYLDGQLASNTGTGVVAEYYSYSVQSNGQKTIQVNMATSTDNRVTKFMTDWLGRTLRTERPGFTGQLTYFDVNTYATTTGLLIRTDHLVGSPNLYQYDVLGNLVLSCFDVNNNGVIDLAGTDRITGQDKWFAFESNAWWLATTSTVYASATSTAATTVKSTRQRLSGFTLTGSLRSETSVTDAEGNITVQKVSVAPTTATVTSTTTLPGLANSQVDVSVNGLAVSSTAPDLLKVTTTYDALQRPQTTVNPRTGITTVAYYANTTQPFTVTDPRNKIVATYHYDTMGRRDWVQNAGGYYNRSDYDLLGHVLHQWGDADYPCSYVYNIYGERTTLNTYRNENNWSATTWPGGTPSGITTWAYDAPSGLLSTKTDNAGKTVTYDYDGKGRVAHRKWARTIAAATQVTATYAYDANTGDLLNTSYNDGTAPSYSDRTPTVAATYNRLGQMLTVSDATGTRTLGWDATAPWRLDTETLPSYYQSQIIERLYESTTDPVAGSVKGRYYKFHLGTAATPNASFEQLYDVDNTGRLASITSSYGAGTGSQNFNYAYIPNSRLVKSLSITGSSFTQTRDYEPKRDLLTSIVGQWSASPAFSSFTYTYNDLGQRQSVIQGGTAFADYGDVVSQNYIYTTRGELQQAESGLGAITPGSPPYNPLSGRDFEYTYDAAGNRKSANHTGSAALREDYTSNDLNQIISRENNSRAIQNTAATDAGVQVNSAAASRQGNFWESELLLNNASGTAVTQASVSIGASASTGAAASLQTLNLLTGGAAETHVYDLDGNLSSDGIWTYNWDAENRLVSMVMNGYAVLPNGPPQQMLQFTYDYLDRRVAKVVSYWQAGAWVPQSKARFIYDGWNLIAETQDDGGTLIRTYTWGLDLAGSLTASGGVGALLRITDHASGVSYFPTYDGNGNVATLVKSTTGAIYASYEYNGFGEILRAQGSYAYANPIRFSSKYTDDETGLVYYGTRYYNPHNGRFVNRDSIGEEGGINIYAFVNNAVPNAWDYLGMGGSTVPGDMFGGGYGGWLAGSAIYGPGYSGSVQLSGSGGGSGVAQSKTVIVNPQGTYDVVFVSSYNQGAEALKIDVATGAVSYFGTLGQGQTAYFQIDSNTSLAVSNYQNGSLGMDYGHSYTSGMVIEGIGLIGDSSRDAAAPNNAGNNTSAWELGVQWLTGNGPRQQNFKDGDPMTALLQQHSHVQDTRTMIANNIANGGDLKGSKNYDLGGIAGVSKYLKDYSTLATGGLTGNLAVTYLGSYNLDYNVTGINLENGTATVQFHVTNDSTINSATHPPWIGYTQTWNTYIGQPLNNFFSSGPMSKTSQDFQWTETIKWP